VNLIIYVLHSTLRFSADKELHFFFQRPFFSSNCRLFYFCRRGTFVEIFLLFSTEAYQMCNNPCRYRNSFSVTIIDEPARFSIPSSFNSLLYVIVYRLGLQFKNIVAQ
jgi:hypothetical protein